MTPIRNDYYYNTTKFSSYVHVNIYRRRANRKWYQREYEFLQYGIFLPSLDDSPHSRALKVVAEIENLQGGMGEKQWAKSMKDKTLRKV